MAQAFSSCLKAEYAIRIQPVKASPGHVGYASLGDTYEMVRGLVKSFLVACDEPGRENELRQLLAITDKMSYWRRPAMVMLAKTVVVDRADGRHITDIDGLSGLFDGSSLNWVVMECKKRGSADGGKQLREGLGPCMIGNVGVVQHFEHGTCEAWSLTVPSPETLKTPELATPNSPLQLRLPFSL
jgi:hypothetical protein